jgi:formate-dependent nitrite reductase membrane component NrfD
MPPSDTFFTGAPHWTWFIIPYFYIGGLAGGAYVLAAVLEWFGRPDDRPVVRTGYDVAAVGAIVSGLLLTIDLGKPLRFWHMLFQSEHVPAIVFKAWSPISFGAWGLMAFGLFAVLSALGARAEEGRLRNPVLRAVGTAVQGRTIAKLLAAVGGVLGFFIAAYTGVLLSVTNRPIWADSPWLGALFVASGTSTGAAILILLAPARGATARSLDWLSAFDFKSIIVELLVLVVFLVSLGPVNRVWMGFWGVMLLIVIAVGIVMPLGLHVKPTSFGGLAARPMANAARLVLLGGLLLRITTLLASEGIDRVRVAAGL